MDKGLIGDKPYQVRDQFIKRKITPVKFYSVLLNRIHSFYGNGRTCKILFANQEGVIESAIKYFFQFITFKMKLRMEFKGKVKIFIK